MRTLRLLFALPLALGTAGCGVIPAVHPAGGYAVSQAGKDMVRAQEAQGYKVTDPLLDDQLAKQEKDLQHVLAVAVGAEPPSSGAPVGEPASAILASLRAAKFKLRIEPITNREGAAVADNFVQLKDSYTDRLQALQGKLVEGSATAAERADIMAGSRQILKLTNLKMQVLNISRFALSTNATVQTNGMSTMLQVAGMVSVRRQVEMEWNDDDYSRVRYLLTRQKTWEAMAAATMGMLAAYESVVAGQGSPKALDAIAAATLKAFPLKVEVSDADVKDYIAHLGDDAMKQKAKYEKMMRGAYGDARYEAQFKQGIDAMFDRAARASETKSISQTVADTRDGYRVDVEKCARGETPGPGSLVSPERCKAAQTYGLGPGPGTGGGGVSVSVGSLFAGAKGAMPAGAGAAAGALGSASKAAGAAGKGLRVAEAMASGDAAGALQGAADMVPGDGPIQSSLQGVAALSKGDYKGALKAALGLASLVPGGGLIAQGLGTAGKLLGLFG